MAHIWVNALENNTTWGVPAEITYPHKNALTTMKLRHPRIITLKPFRKRKRQRCNFFSVLSVRYAIHSKYIINYDINF
jgi:hypothetical protein